MSGRGRTPKPAEQRRGGHAPLRGEYVASEATGWQHGAVPDPPEGLRPESERAWRVWFGAWFAAFWTPADMPGLEMVARLYDRALSPGVTGAERTELRQLMDSYGMTPKGAQDRRWTRPEPPERRPPEPAPDAGPYAHLRAVEDR